MRPKTQSDYIKTALRLPPELHAAVHESAKASGRTFNAEVIALLEGAIKRPALENSMLEALVEEQSWPLAFHKRVLHRMSDVSLSEFARAHEETLSESKDAHEILKDEMSRRDKERKKSTK